MNNVENENKSLLEKILEIDTIAKMKIDEEKKRENEKLQQINLKTQEFLKLMEKKSAIKLDKLKSFKLQEFEKEIQYLENEKTNYISNLEHIFNDNEEIWLKKIFDNILKIE